MTPASAALDRVPWGVVVTDEDGEIVELNAAAATQLKRGDALRVRNNKLEAVPVNRASDLQRMIRGAASSAGGRARAPGGFIRLERPSGKGHLTILVAPLRHAQRNGGKPSANALLFIADSEQPPVAPAARLGQLFGLTPSEASVALAIVAGKTLIEIAALNGVSRNTIRGQTQSVLAKTGVRRQVELVRLILQLPTVR